MVPQPVTEVVGVAVVHPFVHPAMDLGVIEGVVFAPSLVVLGAPGRWPAVPMGKERSL